MKLKMICDSEIGQFQVTEAGLYAWRRKDLPEAVRDDAWYFGVLKEGDKIDGQYEGVGPIKWKSQ